MEFLLFCFLIFVSQVQSQTLLSVLQEHSELSTFNHYVNASMGLTSLLSTADNITLLAPSNTAFDAWLSSQSSPLSSDQIDAILTYHLIHGQFPALAFSQQPQFAASFLTNTSYANVTGGQRLELVSSNDGEPQIVSGNKSVSSITSTDVLFTGGVMQVINTVLTVPLSYVILVTQANFSFVVAILTAGGYLSPADTNLITDVIYRPNMTFFAPNTQEALDEFKILAANMSQAELTTLFEYHAVPDFLGYSTELKSGMQLRTVEGTNVTITIQGNTTFVNGAEIISSDYLVENGVVHMIDRQLNPQNTTGPPPLSSSTGTIVSSTANSSTPNPKSGMSSAAKAGVGVSVPLAIGSLAGGIYFLLRWMRKRKPAAPVISTPNLRRSWVHTRSLRRLPPQELDGRIGENQSMLSIPQDTSPISMQSSQDGFEKWAVELDGRGIP